MSSEMRKAFSAMTQNRRVTSEERLMFEAGWNAAVNWLISQGNGYVGRGKKSSPAARTIVIRGSDQRYRYRLDDKKGT